MTFNVTAIGTGLAGYDVRDISPMFKDVPDNVKLPKSFLDHLYDDYNSSKISFNE